MVPHCPFRAGPRYPRFDLMAQRDLGRKRLEHRMPRRLIPPRRHVLPRPRDFLSSSKQAMSALYEAPDASAQAVAASSCLRTSYCDQKGVICPFRCRQNSCSRRIQPRTPGTEVAAAAEKEHALSAQIPGGRVSNAVTAAMERHIMAQFGAMIQIQLSARKILYVESKAVRMSVSANQSDMNKNKVEHSAMRKPVYERAGDVGRVACASRELCTRVAQLESGQPPRGPIAAPGPTALAIPLYSPPEEAPSTKEVMVSAHFCFSLRRMGPMMESLSMKREELLRVPALQSDRHVFASDR